MLFTVLLGTHRIVEQRLDTVRIGRIETDADMTGQVYRITLDFDRLIDDIENSLHCPGNLFFFRLNR